MQADVKKDITITIDMILYLPTMLKSLLIYLFTSYYVYGCSKRTRQRSVSKMIFD